MHIKIYIKKKFGIKLLAVCLISMAVSFSCWTLSLSKTETDSSDSVSLPILMYHLVLRNPKSRNKFIVSEATFEEDLKYIKENGYTTIFVRDLIDYTEGKSDLPPKPILLTFDDGAFNNYLYAFPLAKKYEAKFIFSPICKEAEKYSQVTDENPNYAHASWEHIVEMSESGFVEIQNHTYDMHQTKKTRLGCTKKAGESLEEYKQNLTSDIKKAQDIIKEKTGIQPTAFFYPFGACSKYSEEIIKSMGFKASFSCESKINRIKRDPNSLFKLYRFLRPPGVPSKKFFSSFENK